MPISHIRNMLFKKKYIIAYRIDIVTGPSRCVVRTSDGKCFFYDPSKRRSVWKRPEELKNRPDVDQILLRNSEMQTGKCV